MSKTPFITLTASLGETITYQIRNIAGINFINMSTNFNPVDHIHFANVYVPCVVGIKGFTGMQIDKGITGTYFFSLTSNYVLETVKAGIASEFNTYFLTLDKNPIK
jgi:hypothetical protein